MSAEKLTPKQTAFVKSYCRLGGMNATQAAIAAGYSGHGKGAGAAVSASRMLQQPHILNAIREETERTLRAGVALGAQVLDELARGAVSESVRLQAAQALLDRGGMQLANLSEHHVIVEDKRTDAELRCRVEELARELGLAAKVIPGELVDLPTLQSEGPGCKDGYKSTPNNHFNIDSNGLIGE
jgi:hypothetical protein